MTTSVTGNQSAAVPDGMGSAERVPNGTSAQGSGDATTGDTSAFQSQIEKLEQDRRNLQSVYDRKLAEAQRERDTMRQQLEELRVKDMSEADKAAFEANKYRQEYEALRQQIEAERQMRDYAQAFSSTFGIPIEKLDMTSQETLAQSGWQAVADLVSELKQIQTNPAAQSGTRPQIPQQKVITGSGGMPRTKPSHTEMIQAVAQKLGKSFITEDEFYQYMERHPDLMNQWLQP